MGQYYKPISIEAKQFLYSHNYDNGLKLMEHSWVGNNFVQAAITMLRSGGQWYKTRIVWAGDYMDEGLFMDEKIEGETLYSYASNNFEEVNPHPCSKKTGYITNHSKQEFCKIPSYEKDNWKPHPLPLLTCSGNGRGGGDYRKQNEFIGVWAGDIISIEDKKPKGFKEIAPDFIED